MKAFDTLKLFAEFCNVSKKWGLYISTCMNVEESELIKAAPFLTIPQDLQIVSDGVGVFLFDSEEEMLDHYGVIVGDDGPTVLNKYNGPARWYALTCNPNGKFLDENT